MKIDFNVCGGPSMGPLAVGSCKTKPAFGETVLTLHNNTEWPPRSPDLTPCYFLLWV